MLIEATSQTTLSSVYVLTGNDDLNVASGITLLSLAADAVLANSGQHSITVSGSILAYDDAINTIGCEAAQTVVIAAGGLLLAGYTGVEPDADGVMTCPWHGYRFDARTGACLSGQIRGWGPRGGAAR